MFRYDVELVRAIDLRDPEALDRLGVTREELLARDQVRSREIGEAAARLGVHAMLPPSATGIGDVLAVMLDNLAGSRCEHELLTTGTHVGDVGTGT